MPVDTSIYGSIKPVDLVNPLDNYAKFSALQSAQNQNALFPMQMQSMQLANQQKQQQFDMIRPILARMANQSSGSSQSNPLMPQTPTSNASVSTNPLTGNSQGVPTDDGVPYSLGDLAALSAAGYPGAAEMLKVKQAAMQGTEFKPGSTYERGGKTFTIPQLDKGMRMGANGQVEAIPGYSDTNAGIQGAQTNAQEQAKNNNMLAPLDRINPKTGQPYTGTMGSLISQQSQPAPANPGAQGPQGLDLSKLNPQQIAFLAKSNPQAFANGAQDFQGTSNQQSAGGYTPPTTGLDGSPLPPQASQALALIANSRDPAKLNQFTQTFTQNITHLSPDQQQAAMANLKNEVSGIQKFWQQSPQQGQSNQASSGFNGFMSPADMEADKQAKLANVKLNTEPGITYANDAAKALSAKAENVGGQLSESQALLQRIQESRDALSQFKSGGGAETRVQMAKYAQAIPGMPQSVIDGLAGGSLSAAQQFQKYAAQEALQTMRQSLSSDTGQGSQGNRVAMQLFIKNNPNIDTDPNAIEKIFNFQTKLHNELLNKSDMLTKFIADPTTTKDPAIFDNMYAHSQINSGNVKPQMTQGQAKGTTPKTVPPTNPQGWVLHIDAKGNKAYVSPDGKQFQEVQ